MVLKLTNFLQEVRAGRMLYKIKITAVGQIRNLQGIQFVFFERHNLIHMRLLCKKQQIN